MVGLHSLANHAPRPAQTPMTEGAAKRIGQDTSATTVQARSARKFSALRPDASITESPGLAQAATIRANIVSTRRMRSRTYITILVCVVLASCAYLWWASRPPDLVAAGRSVAEALCDGDTSELVARMSVAELEKLSKQQVEAGWKAVLSKMGGSSLTIIGERNPSTGAKEAECVYEVMAPDGVRFLLTSPVFSESNRSVVSATQTILQIINMYWKAKFHQRTGAGPDINYFREAFESSGWKSFYDRYEGLWYSLDELCTMQRRKF